MKNVEIDAEEASKADLSYMKKLLRSQLIESKNNVEIIRKDPNSPLYSVKTFEELRLPDELLKGLYALGYQKPSKIQETVLPLLISNPPQNLIAQSQSGTGKTAAFLLAALKRVNIKLNNPQVLILSPTLELALQIADVAKQMARFTEITFRHVIKGEVRPPGPVEEHVIIGTPGKMSGRDRSLATLFHLQESEVPTLNEFSGHSHNLTETLPLFRRRLGVSVQEHLRHQEDQRVRSRRGRRDDRHARTRPAIDQAAEGVKKRLSDDAVLCYLR